MFRAAWIFTCLCMLSFCYCPVNGAVIKGKVTSPAGSALPFVNVFVKNTTSGTATNEDGRFELTLAPGQYTIVFKYISYQRYEREVSLDEGQEQVINVTLKPQNVQLNEVVVTEDNPADRIMRNVIAHRKEHLNQVNAYSCNTYIKGLQRLTKAPEKILGKRVNYGGMLDSNNTGIFYLSESRSEFYYEEPDQTKEVMTASKVSGNNQAFSWNMASFFQFNIYKNNLRLEPISERMFITPTSSNAFFYYDFDYKGSYVEQGQLIHKIRVNSKRETDPAFHGDVYVVDSLWRLKSFDLQLTKDEQLNYVDSIRWKQVFEPLNDTVWMPLKKRFEFSFSIGMIDVAAEGYFVSVYKDYQIQDDFPKGFFSNEILAIEDSANLRDSIYWNQIRPIPLTDEEENDYERKDSIYEVRTSQEYLDSIDRISNRFQPMDLLLGYDYQRRFLNFHLSTDGALKMLQYNTVEGAVINVGADIRKYWDDERELQIRPELRYGFSNNLLNGQVKFSHYYDPNHFGEWGAEVGTFVRQYDPAHPVKAFNNTMYSLLLEDNFMKLYDKTFVKIRHSRELWNGIKLNTELEWSERDPLMNSTDYKWVEFDDRSFTSNFPLVDGEQQPSTFSQHQAITFSADLRIRFGQKYLSRPEQKIIISSPYPELSFHYKKSIPGILGTDLNYDFLAAEVRGDIPLGLFGNTDFRIKGGSFVNKEEVTFPDFQHFTGNVTLIGHYSMDAYERLPYYDFSTLEDHVEVHVNHHFDGFIFNKIPAVRKLEIQAVAEARGFYLANDRYHIEVSGGIENIFRTIFQTARIDYVVAFPEFNSWWQGFKLGVQF